ncbi:hypothetical protein CMI37_18345 [Candidatus Pacearchaeota archaeon]|jgi:hypothetical protein|nr:hypothetical protein [Candidatus Pacearchaeota archaeon]|tara:strand:+ start:91 stop:405 length:315 start_codon:yes stop_codon:yes gene_type:complete
MSFDPSNYTVRNAIEELDGMSLEDLESVLEQEIDGKHRSSLIAEIGRHIDGIKTVAEQSEEAPKPVAPSVVVAEEINADAFMRMRPAYRRVWKCVGPDRFVKVG